MEARLMIFPPPPCLTNCLAAIWERKNTDFCPGTDPCVVYQNIQPAKRIQGLFHNGFQLRHLANIRLDWEKPAPKPFHVPLHFDRRTGSVHTGDGCARLRQSFGDAAADAVAAACHQRSLALE